jgi:hypothetical protein
VIERVVAALANSRQDNGHVKLSPTLLIDAERRLLYDCVLLAGLLLSQSALGSLTVLVLLE